jgi:hypothetical protein
MVGGKSAIGGRWLAKFAGSEPTAERLWHEARVLGVLGSRSEFRVPEIVVASTAPVFFATRLITGGVPLSYELVAALETPPMRADCDEHRLVLRLAVALFGVGSGLDEREVVDGHDLVGFVQERNSDRRVGC